MKLLIFSDIHNDLRALERLLSIEADYYVAAGDLVSWAKGLEKTGEVLRRRENVIVLPGNHESESDIAAFCERFGFQAFHGQTMEIGDWKVAGLGYSNPTPFNTPGEYSEAEIARRLAPFANLSPLVLICHCPPQGTALDRLSGGGHAGSTAIRDFIDRRQPAWFFCGHIHEAEGVETTVGRTRGVNVGKKGFLLDFDKIKSE
ncbi:MAG: metallophosphoesterase family protein [Bryobacteraceae bacterium]